MIRRPPDAVFRPGPSLVLAMSFTWGSIVACGQNSETPIPARNDPPTAKSEEPVAARERRAADPLAGEVEGRLWFSVGADTILVLKVADRDHLLPAGFPAGDAFRQALSREPDAPLVLVHLVVPHRLFPVELGRRDGPSNQKLSDPVMIFRMPRSPRYTFAIVRTDRLPVLEASSADGRTGSIDLSRWAVELSRQRLWRNPATGFVSYGRIPRSFYGKMGP